jgi:hypothetical protein
MVLILLPIACLLLLLFLHTVEEVAAVAVLMMAVEAFALQMVAVA